MLSMLSMIERVRAAHGGVAMMDVILGGSMGFVLAVLLTSPPRPKKVKVVTSKIVEDAPDPKAKAAKKR